MRLHHVLNRLHRLFTEFASGGARHRGHYLVAADGERTRALFEPIAGYAQPSLIPLPSLGDRDTLERFGVRPGFLARLLFRAGFELSGFGRFSRIGPDDLERVLRHTDIRRGACAPIVSATVTLVDDPRQPTMLQRASSLVLGARLLHRDIMSGVMPQARHEGVPLEMGLYPNLFATSIAIEGERIRIRKSAETSAVGIACRGQLYTLNVSDLQRAHHSGDLEEVFARIVDDTSGDAAGHREPAVGVLTADRDTAQVRHFVRLTEDPDNRDSIARLRDVLFTVCLEPDTYPESLESTSRLAHTGHYANRWSHSSLQLVIFGNGMAAAICSWRAWLDGNEMVHGAAEIQRRASTVALSGPDETRAPGEMSVRKLTWRAEPELLTRAMTSVQEFLDDDPLAAFTIPDIGERDLSAGTHTPIPVFVVALAWAVKRVAGRLPAIHQFLAMSKYRCLGVVRVDVTTSDVVRCVELLDGGDGPDPARAIALLRAAIVSQNAECALARRVLPISMLQSIFHGAHGGLPDRVSRTIESRTLGLLRRMNRYRVPPCDIMISHPAIRPEIAWVGRPGARLPFVPMFALHYALHEDHVTGTIARGSEWHTPNRELIAELRATLREIAGLLASEGGARA